MSDLPEQRTDNLEDEAIEHTDDRPWPNHPKYLGPTGVFTGSVDELTDEQVEAIARQHQRLYPRRELIFEPPDAAAPAQEAPSVDSAASAGAASTTEDSLATDETASTSSDSNLAHQQAESAGESTDLDRPLTDEPDAPTIRQVLERFAGPEGLTEEQRQADEAYVATYGDNRPWLRISDDPLVRHVYCERDRQGGHDPARHDVWRDAEAQRERAEGLKDPAHATDSAAYHNSVDAFKGQTPPDNIGGSGKQHRCGEHTTWINDPVIWAAATARLLEHPRVKEALASSNPPASIKDISISEVVGPDGHRFCSGYSLKTDDFESVQAAIDNRRDWVFAVREVQKANKGMGRDEAETIVEQDSDYSMRKPEVEMINTFKEGNFQLNLRQRAGTVEIVTICVNPQQSNNPSQGPSKDTR